MNEEPIEHRAFMYMKYGDNHAECYGCDWIGPTRDSLVQIQYDCADHEQEFEDDED